MDFQPSSYSGFLDAFTSGQSSNPDGAEGDAAPGAGAGQAAAGLVSAAGSIFNFASVIASNTAAKKQQKRDYEASMALTSEQAKLEAIRLQAQQASIEANKYAAMAQGMGTQKLVYIMGGFVLLGGLAAVTMVLLKRREE